jgi:hypothetical protein
MFVSVVVRCDGSVATCSSSLWRKRGMRLPRTASRATVVASRQIRPLHLYPFI